MQIAFSPLPTSGCSNKVCSIDTRPGAFTGKPFWVQNTGGLPLELGD
jgi:hypothetical protein